MLDLQTFSTTAADAWAILGAPNPFLVAALCVAALLVVMLFAAAVQDTTLWVFGRLRPAPASAPTRRPVGVTRLSPVRSLRTEQLGHRSVA